MHMRHTLPRRLSILNSHIKRLGFIDPLQRLLDARDGVEEIGYFFAREIGEVWFDAKRRDEDVARKEGFEVDDCKGVGGCMEDLPRGGRNT